MPKMVSIICCCWLAMVTRPLASSWVFVADVERGGKVVSCAGDNQDVMSQDE
jgi:hypothetical protein